MLTLSNVFLKSILFVSLLILPSRVKQEGKILIVAPMSGDYLVGDKKSYFEAGDVVLEAMN